MARSSAICTPQTGSRTSRRELMADCCWAVGPLCWPLSVFKNPRSIQATTRRNIATVQHSTTSHIKNRIIWEENSSCVYLIPPVIVCKGKRQSQTKSSDFNSLRGEELVPQGEIWVQYDDKILFINKIDNSDGFVLCQGRNLEFLKLRLGGRDEVNAHVWAQYVRDDDRAIGLLIIFHDGDPGTPHGEAGTV